MRNNFLGFLGLFLTTVFSYGQGLNGPDSVGQKSAAEMISKNSEAAAKSVMNITADLIILGAGKFVTDQVGTAFNNQRNLEAKWAETKIQESIKSGITPGDYDDYLHEGAKKNSVAFADDLQKLRSKALDLGIEIEKSEIFKVNRIDTTETPDQRLGKLRYQLNNTNTEVLLSKSQELRNEIRKFSSKYPEELERLPYIKENLNPAMFDLQKLNSLKMSVAAGTDTLDMFDFESVKTNLNNAFENSEKILKSNRIFLNNVVNKKISKSITQLKQVNSPGKGLKAIKAAGWAGTAFIAVDIYGNILNLSSDNPRPNVAIGQLGLEILTGTPEAIFEAAKKRIEQKSAADRGTVDELDPTQKKNH